DSPKEPRKSRNSSRNTDRKAPKDFTKSYPKDFTRDFAGGRKKGQKSSKKRDSIDNFSAPTGDWRELMKPKKWDFKGDEPDFSEEGWALRKPRKGKKAKN
ncbi:MAG: hypothetical protein IKX17_04885, partial [Prevotella sp.]|nr:hypothetical protein [Prevotella sp.]